MSSLLVFNKVYRLEIQSVMLVFSIILWTIAPLPPLWPPPPLPPSQIKRTIYTDNVGCWGGGGVFSCVVDHILQEFNTLFLIRFGIYKNTTQKKSPVKTTFRDWCLYSSFVQGGHYQDHWPGAGSLWGGRGCEGWQNSVPRVTLAAQWSNWKRPQINKQRNNMTDDFFKV